ncbi:DUF3052 domain-containing protein [Streptomyces sp. NPDC058718]|uniref:DUF3052 domain-containing protein n=1 Tax=Streptomyces sp. NPDC058718 TaxID=3346610 RepID=UPI0036946813
MTDAMIISPADRLGIEPGQLVLEVGRGDDSDADVRASVEARTGRTLAGEGVDGEADAALLWFREGDGDLVDTITDVSASLSGAGVLWVLTPKSGRDGYVEPSEIAESATMAGMAQTSAAAIAADWSGTRLVKPNRR